MNRRECSEAELQAFVAAYPRALVVDVYRVPEPPVVTWNDFSLGVWPQSIVCGKVLESYLGDPATFFVCETE
jgi:hypothetical protein